MLRCGLHPPGHCSCAARRRPRRHGNELSDELAD